MQYCTLTELNTMLDIIVKVNVFLIDIYSIVCASYRVNKYVIFYLIVRRDKWPICTKMSLKMFV